MIWSYSRLTTYQTCPYSFYLRYLYHGDDYPVESNFWAELGVLMHEIFEKIFKGEMTEDDAPGYFIDHYQEFVHSKQKPNIIDKANEDCLSYLAEMLFDWLKDYEIVGVEKRVEYQFGDYKFMGFIDLLLKDKKTGGYIVVDHKSCKKFFGSNGHPLKNMEHKLEEYKRQMYLYSKAVFTLYDEYPQEIWWHHFRDFGYLTKLDFDMNEYESAEQWFLDTVAKIEEDEEFKPNEEYFFCHNLCNFRSSCEYKKEGDRNTWKEMRKKKKR